MVACMCGLVCMYVWVGVHVLLLLLFSSSLFVYCFLSSVDMCHFCLNQVCMSVCVCVCVFMLWVCIEGIFDLCVFDCVYNVRVRVMDV